MSRGPAYVCIHGHFYQPPRENPWLDAIEIQDSAAPYHDWNERIAAECYAPNADSRVLDDAGRIERIVNNYARIGFNVGPTLAGWLERHEPETHAAIVEADRQGARRFDGHGPALAQVYNHSILPLAAAHDRRTQIAWGLADFEHRFGRPAEGMWLPETAADTATLEALAEAGLRFTILAPLQAAAVRRIGGSDWADVRGGAIDGTVPYRALLPSGRELALFFYDGPLSRAVAFEGALHDGRAFGRRVARAALAAGPGRLAHLATDGESYGHHHRHGDMALAAALDEIEAVDGVALTSHGALLSRTPPRHEVRLVEPSAWSCAHGVGRWSEDCGCRAGGASGWHQGWRAPLRGALDALRDRLDPLFEAEGARLLRDPWAARDEQIELILDESPAARDAFLARHAREPLDTDGALRALRLLEMQRHAQLMYTSCGWFFDELSGIETVQILRYAARAIDLAAETTGASLEDWFVERLRAAPSNLPKLVDGEGVWLAHVAPARVDAARAVANAASARLFEAEPHPGLDAGFDRSTARLEHGETVDGAAWQTGRTRLIERRTRRPGLHEWCVVRTGELELVAHVREADAPDAPPLEALPDALARARIVELPALFGRWFDGKPLGMGDLLREQQRRILERVSAGTVARVERLFEQLQAEHHELLVQMSDMEMPPPAPFRAIAEQEVNRRLLAELHDDPAPAGRIGVLVREAKRTGAALDGDRLSIPARDAVRRAIRAWTDGDQPLESATALVRTIVELPFEVDLRLAQDRFYRSWRRGADPAIDELGRLLGFVVGE